MARILKPDTETWANRTSLAMFPNSSYYVEPGHAAISNKKLSTAGLYSCAAVAICYGGTNFLCHVDANVNPSFIKESLLGAFNGLNLDQHPDFKIEIVNGNIVSKQAHNVLQEAIVWAKLEDRTISRERHQILTLFDTVHVDGNISIERSVGYRHAV